MKKGKTCRVNATRSAQPFNHPCGAQVALQTLPYPPHAHRYRNMNQIVRQKPEGGRPPSLPLDKNLSWMSLFTSDDGDLDGDGSINVVEYTNVSARGDWDDFTTAATTAWMSGLPLPAASKTGLYLAMGLVIAFAFGALYRKSIRRQ